MEELFIIGVVLLVVTLLGHGIWVVLSLLVRAVFGAGKNTDGEPRFVCPTCGKQTSALEPRCDWCGRAQPATTVRAIEDLVAFRRQLFRLKETGLIDRDQFETLVAAANTYRVRLRQPTASRVGQRSAADQSPATVGTKQQTSPNQETPAEAALVGPIRAELAQAEDGTVQPIPEAPAPKPQLDSSRVPTAEPSTPQPATDATTQLPQPVAAGTESRMQAAEPPAGEIPSDRSRRSWDELLAAFMEERNIRWGEIIGGLLIVCSSTALVMSLWDTLEQLPYFQFALFVGVTSAIFSAGLYAHHRWNLKATSHGLLVVGSLLVPLNFLAMGRMSAGQGNVSAVLTGLLALGLFTWMLRSALRILLPHAWRSAMAGVTGNCALVLLARPWLDRVSAEGVLILAACLPALAFDLSVGFQLWRTRRFGLSRRQSKALFTLLGLAAFAAVAAAGLVAARAYETLDATRALDLFALPLVLFAVPVAAIGLRVMRSTGDDASARSLQTSGRAFALVGMTLKVTALALAWPNPLGILVVGLLNGFALVYLAVRFRFELLHTGAMACFALAYISGFYLIFDDTLAELSRHLLQPRLLELIVGAQTGTALGGLFLAFGGVSEWLLRRGNHRHSRVYAGGATAVAIVGLLLVTFHDASGGADALRAAALYAVYGGGSLVLAARWGWPAMSYLGLGLLGAAPLWAAWWQTANAGPLWVVLLLLDATLAMAARAGLAWSSRTNSSSDLPSRRLALLTPLEHTAFWATGLAVGMAALVHWPELLWASECLAWAATILLGLAWVRMQRLLVILGQVLLAAAALLTTDALLQTPTLAFGPRLSLADLLHVQAYGIGLALTCLAWMAVRVLTRDNRRAMKLLDRDTLLADQPLRYALAGLLWAGLAVACMVGTRAELGGLANSAATRAWVAAALGVNSWLLWFTLTAATLTSLFTRFTRKELVVATLLGLSVPLLLAGPFAESLAVGSAARWTWALAAGGFGIVLWLRGRIAARVGPFDSMLRLRLAGNPARLVRRMVDALAVAPALALTVFAALLQFEGTLPSGPGADSLFANVGPVVSYLMPLVLIAMVWVGHALRERSAGYAFAAGWVLQLAVVLGYPMTITLGGGSFGTFETFALLQAATTLAAVWALGWMAVRRRLDIWREQDAKPTATRLMSFQVFSAALAGAAWLFPAIVDLAAVYPYGAGDWSRAAGAPLGWLAFISSGLAMAWLQVQRQRRVDPRLAGLLGMSTIGLLACSVQAWQPDWGYRTLMLGWAIYCVLVVASTWSLATRSRLPGAAGPPQAMVRAAATWVKSSATLTVVLGLKAAFWLDQPLWAALAIAMASGAAATMAIWRRRETWAFAAALGVNLAASLVVWHFYQPWTFGRWWLELVKYNIVASASVGLIWLAAHQRLVQLGENSLRRMPLLAVQIGGPAVVWIGLLVLAFIEILGSPEQPPAELAQLANGTGWSAWALLTMACGWFSVRLHRGGWFHVVAASLAGAAILAACSTAGPVETIAWQPWFSYYLLIVAWLLSAIVLLGVGWWNHRDERVAADATSSATGASFGLVPRLSAPWRVPGRWVENWTTTLSLASGAVALLAWTDDPRAPWVAGAAVLCASTISALLAVWRGNASQVILSGLLPNLVATLAWATWSPGSWPQLIWFNAIALAVASIGWTSIGLIPRTRVPRIRLHPAEHHFAHLGGLAALVLLASAACAGLTTGVIGAAYPEMHASAWWALGAVLLALVMSLTDRRAQFAAAALHVVGLVALAQSQLARAPSFHELAASATVELAGYGLAAALIAWAVRLATWRPGKISHRAADPTSSDDSVRKSRLERFEQLVDRIQPAQAALFLTVVLLGSWVAIDFAFESARFGGWSGLLLRWCGPLGLALCVAGCGIMSLASGRADWRTIWQRGGLLTAGLAAGSAGWSMLPATLPAPWLHRAVIGAVAASAVSSLYSNLLPRLLSAMKRAQGTWAGEPGRVAGLLGATGAVLAAIALALETWHHVDVGSVPMAGWAIAAMFVLLTGLAVRSLLAAVLPAWDPMGWNTPRRTSYVYAAEALLLLVGLHAYLTVPQWFQLGIVEQYWMLLVMSVAFVGAGLGEWFRRRGVDVLSLPLERTAAVLPLVPGVGFWFAPQGTAAMWLMMGLFYGVMATTRRLWMYGVLSILAANTGLWVLWHRMEIGFFDHPQLWLVPIALAVLVAEQIDRRRLQTAQRSGIRYVALSAIYVSSTADMFIAGLGNSWILPLVLLLLSVGGVLTGMMLRLRSFVYLGATFLVVVLSTMLKYAAVDLGQSWILYLATLLLGMMVFALFAVFEKRRNTIVKAVERFRNWEV